MAIFDSPDALAEYLAESGVDCLVLDDGLIQLPIPEADLIGTLHLTGGWLVFKVFIGEWHPRSELAACQTLLLLQDRLTGFRFSVADGDLWILQDFPVDALSHGFHMYVDHVFYVLGTILPSLRTYLESSRAMSNDEIDAMFDRLDAEDIHECSHSEPLEVIAKTAVLQCLIHAPH